MLPVERRRRFKWTNLFVVSAAIGVASVVVGQAPTPAVGSFQSHADVGTVLHAGSAAFDPATRTYTVSGSGENVWGAADAFQRLTDFHARRPVLG